MTVPDPAPDRAALEPSAASPPPEPVSNPTLIRLLTFVVWPIVLTWELAKVLAQGAGRAVRWLAGTTVRTMRELARFACVALHAVALTSRSIAARAWTLLRGSARLVASAVRSAGTPVRAMVVRAWTRLRVMAQALAAWLRAVGRAVALLLRGWVAAARAIAMRAWTRLRVMAQALAAWLRAVGHAVGRVLRPIGLRLMTGLRSMARVVAEGLRLVGRGIRRVATTAARSVGWVVATIGRPVVSGWRLLIRAVRGGWIELRAVMRWTWQLAGRGRAACVAALILIMTLLAGIAEPLVNGLETIVLLMTGVVVLVVSAAWLRVARAVGVVRREIRRALSVCGMILSRIAELLRRVSVPALRAVRALMIVIGRIRIRAHLLARAVGHAMGLAVSEIGALGRLLHDRLVAPVVESIRAATRAIGGLFVVAPLHALRAAVARAGAVVRRAVGRAGPAFRGMALAVASAICRVRQAVRETAHRTRASLSAARTRVGADARAVRTSVRRALGRGTVLEPVVPAPGPAVPPGWSVTPGSGPAVPSGGSVTRSPTRRSHPRRSHPVRVRRPAPTVVRR